MAGTFGGEPGLMGMAREDESRVSQTDNSGNSIYGKNTTGPDGMYSF